MYNLNYVFQRLIYQQIENKKETPEKRVVKILADNKLKKLNLSDTGKSMHNKI